MQILHPFRGSVPEYVAQAQAEPVDAHRPAQCPQCPSSRPMTGHGWYQRTIVDPAYDGTIRIRRYWCEACRRTVSLLPEFALPYLRSSITVIALWLLLRLSRQQPAELPVMPYQRGQFWLRRFRRQAEAISAGLAALTKPPWAGDFVARALAMLEATGWIGASRFLFGELRQPLLGWPPSLVPDGRRVALTPGGALT